MITAIKYFMLRLRVKYYFFSSRNNGYYYLMLVVSKQNIATLDLCNFINRLKLKIDNELFRKKRQLHNTMLWMNDCGHPAHLYMLGKYNELCKTTFSFYQSFAEFLEVETTFENWKKDIPINISKLSLLNVELAQQFKHSKKYLINIIEYGFYLPIIIFISAHYAVNEYSYYYTIFIELIILILLYPIYDIVKQISLKLLYIPHVK